MAKYKKRADGRYSTSIMLDIDGVKKKKYVYGKTIKEVDDKIAELRSQANKGIVVDDRSLTMGEWALKWLDTYKKNVSYNTKTMYKRIVERYIIPNIGDIQLREIKKYMLQNMINKIVDEGHTRTAEQAKLTLSQIIAAAIDENYIFVDVTRGINVPRRIKQEKRVLTDEEIKNIYSKDLSVKERAFISILLYTGLRRGEALALKWTDVDFENKKLNVDKTAIFEENVTTIKAGTKSDAGMRRIPLAQNLIDDLNLLKSVNSTEWVFPMFSDEEPMTRSAFRKFWEKLKNKGIPKNISPHSFRHTYATKLYYAGVDVKTAQYLLGHSNIQITLDIYTHLKNADNGAEVREIINDLYK